MAVSPKWILFEQEFYTPHGTRSPLFDNINEVVRIMNTSKYQSHFSKVKKENSLRVEVYNLFKGIVERKSSQEVLTVLMKIVADRLSERGITDAEQQLSDLLHSFGSSSNSETINLELTFPYLFKVKKEHKTFNDYSDEILKADNVIVITREPSELLHNPDSCTSAISELTLFILCRYFISSEKKPRIAYYFPEQEKIEKRFWLKIRDLLLNKIKNEPYLLDQFTTFFATVKGNTDSIDLEEAVTQFLADCQKESLITVQEINDPKLFLINLTVFNPDNTLSSKGFYHRTSENDHINPMSFSDRLYWISEIWKAGVLNVAKSSFKFEKKERWDLVPL